jgi:hypothetical protein
MCDQVHPYLDNPFSGYDPIYVGTNEYFNVVSESANLNKLNNIKKIREKEMVIFKKLNGFPQSQPYDYNKPNLFSKEGVRLIDKRSHIKNNIEDYFVNNGKTLINECTNQIKESYNDLIQPINQPINQPNSIIDTFSLDDIIKNPQMLRFFIILLFIVVIIQYSEIKSQKLFYKTIISLNKKKD